jgi:hypothetical protein
VRPQAPQCATQIVYRYFVSSHIGHSGWPKVPVDECRRLGSIVVFRTSSQSIARSQQYYLPGKPPCCAMAAFCSWKRSPNRCDPFMCLSTHRMTQLSSREVSDLLSKLLTQCSKQFWTRLEYICMMRLARFSWMQN